MSGCIGKRGARPKKKSAPTRIRTAQDYKHKLPMVLHDDGLKAYEEIKKRFNGRARAQREAMNNAVMLYAKVSREMKLGPGDPIEEILGLGK